MRISDWSSDVCSSDLPCRYSRRRCAVADFRPGNRQSGAARRSRLAADAGCDRAGAGAATRFTLVPDARRPGRRQDAGLMVSGEATSGRWLLLSRPDCHLCEAFEIALCEHLGAQPPMLDHADVDTRGEWRMRYGTRIPVLLDEHGQVLAEGIFDADFFERNLRR